MISSFSRQLRLLRFFAITLVAIFAVTTANAQRKVATPDPDKPKVRAITAFLNLDRTQYQPQIADALKMLKYARTVFESRGYEVQTIRIATQPFPEFTKGLTTEQALAFFRNYDAVAVQEKFAANIGPAMLDADAPESQADLLAEILKSTKSLNASLVVAGEDGVRWRSVGAAARVMKKLEDTEHSQGNFRFAALAMVPPLSPFFPAAYHTGFGHQFAIALESANVVANAFKGASDLRVARQKLTDALSNAAFDVQDLAGRIDRDTGWAYVGIDLSPAPLKDVSIGAAIENLTGQPVGTAGTLTAAATITAAIKPITVKQTGYSGLMVPVL
jgi:hypothetical protein